MKFFQRMLNARGISPEREALISRYVELTGIPTDQPSHGVAVRARLRELNPLRADEAELVGIVWQGGIDAAEIECARRGANFTATKYLSDIELKSAIALYEEHGYTNVIAIAQAVESGKVVSDEEQQLYRQVDESTWAKKVVKGFRDFTSEPANSQFLKDAIEACCEVMERSLADKNLVSAFRGDVQ